LRRRRSLRIIALAILAVARADLVFPKRLSGLAIQTEGPDRFFLLIPGTDEEMVAPDDGSRCGRAGHRNRPLDVLGPGELYRQPCLGRGAVEVRPSPLWPIFGLRRRECE